MNTTDFSGSKFFVTKESQMDLNEVQDKIDI